MQRFIAALITVAGIVPAFWFNVVTANTVNDCYDRKAGCTIAVSTETRSRLPVGRKLLYLMRDDGRRASSGRESFFEKNHIPQVR